MSVLLLIVGILLFIGLVVIHEWGHFIMARRNGVIVEEFGIFFPPRLFKHRTKGGWNFTINLLPLGGFVRLKGEHDADTEKGSYGAASLWAKSKIMAAGVVMNLVTAIVLLMVLAWVGMPQLVDNQFTVKSDTKVTQSQVIAADVVRGSAAARAGLQANDRIVSLTEGSICPPKNSCTQSVVQGSTITSPDELMHATQHYAGRSVYLNYYHKGVFHSVATKLLDAKTVEASKKTDNPKGYLGVVPSSYTLQRSTWSAPVVALGLSWQFTVLTFQGLGHAVAGLGSIIAGAVTGNTQARQHGQTSASSQVAGPVGIFVILQDSSLRGYQFMLFVIALISLTLAIMNILPIPALDGGRLWLTLITRGLKRPLSPHREEVINATGMAFLLALIGVLIVVDIKRFIL